MNIHERKVKFHENKTIAKLSEITLSFTAEGKSCPSRDFLT